MINSQLSWKEILEGKKRAVNFHWLKLWHRLPEMALEEIAQTWELIPDPIREDICMPPHHGFPHDDFTPLIAIGQQLRPKVILELGTAYGNTTANLCRSCPQATIYTVNAPAETMTGRLVTFSLGPEEIGRVYRKHGYADRVVQLFANTLHLDLGDHLPGPVVDYAIIDACHDIDYVINDFQKVLPYMSGRGVMLLHDTHPQMEEHTWGSYVACLRLRKMGHDIRHLKGTWWGIWRAAWDHPVG